MGVDLGDLTIKHKASVADFSGKPIAIDGMNMLYQFLASIRQEDGTPLKDFKGRVTGHLSGLFYRTAKLASEGLKPVYVFDGEPPKFKEKEIERRREVKKEAALKFMLETDRPVTPEEIDTYLDEIGVELLDQALDEATSQ